VWPRHDRDHTLKNADNTHLTANRSNFPPNRICQAELADNLFEHLWVPKGLGRYCTLG